MTEPLSREQVENYLDRVREGEAFTADLLDHDAAIRAHCDALARDNVLRKEECERAHRQLAEAQARIKALEARP